MVEKMKNAESNHKDFEKQMHEATEDNANMVDQLQEKVQKLSEESKLEQ